MPFTQNLAATFVKQPRHGIVQIVNADGGAGKSVVTAGGSGSKVTSLIATSSDTSARDIQVGIQRSSTFYPLATTAVPITAGQIAATAPVDLLAVVPAGALAVDNDGQKYLFLESGDVLQVAALTTVTSAKAITVHADYGDF